MTAPKIRIATIFRLALGIFLLCGAALAQTPVLFFSDLTFGPNTGWNNGSSQGAAVTIWGKNFGSTQGSSYVTIGGVQATSYPEWDVIGPARSLERITFFIPTTAATGSQTISVTVNGVTSNTLPFTVDNTTPIYYISIGGSDSNNGRTTSTPWADLYMFDYSHNPKGDSQYIVYVRSGTYSSACSSISAAICTYASGSPTGGPTKQKALVGYPGDTIPVVNTTKLSYGFWYMPWDYSPYNPNNYYTFSKLSMYGGGSPFTNISGDYIRIVGLYMYNYNQSSDSGVVTFQASQGSVVYGNLFSDNGYSSLEHDLYVQTQTIIPRSWVAGDHASQQIDIAWNEVTGYTTSSSGADFFISGHQTTLQYETNNIWVHHNFFHDGVGTYVYIDDNYIDYDIYVYDNLFVNGQGEANGAVMVENTCTSCYFYANSEYHGATAVTYGQLWARGGVGTANIYSQNNIWYGVSNEPPIYQGGTLWTIASDHDLFYNDGTYSAPSTSGLTVTNGMLDVNPQFANVSTESLQLTANSPHATAANMTSSMSSLPSGLLDYVGVTRPNSAWDPGAYQYQSSSSSAPIAPTGLTAVVQ